MTSGDNNDNNNTTTETGNKTSVVVQKEVTTTLSDNYNSSSPPQETSSSSGFNFNQQMSAGTSAGASAAAAAAAAANNANSSNEISRPVSSDPNSIQSILANNMPKHLMDRSNGGGGESNSAVADGSMSMGITGQDGTAGGAPMGAVAAAAAANQHHPVAEFLYQLTKMLTDDNSEIIEWVDGRIKVHYPERLEDEVLHKYFRHSKFASFQRQLNYFGFRKIAGKGKMSPCSYVNEGATSDIRSLLLIKRKTNGSAARKAMAQRAAALNQFNGLGGMNGMGGMPAMVGNAAGLGTAGLQGLAGLQLQLQMQKQLGVNINPATFHANSSANSLAGLDAFSFGGAPGAGAPGNVNAPAANQLSQFLLQSQAGGDGIGRNSFADFQAFAASSAGGSTSAAPAVSALAAGQNQPPTLSAMATLEQLQAQLTELQNQASAAGASGNEAASAALNAAAMNLAQASSGLSQLWPGGPTSAAANSSVSGGAGGNDNPATAALNASAALDNPSSQSQYTNMNSLFESATNLKALIGNESSENKTSSNPLNGFQSTGAFQNSLSNVSLGNLLSSNARLSSLLSLNSFLSREPSLADLAMMQPRGGNNTVNQYAAFQQHAAQQQMNLGGGAASS